MFLLLLLVVVRWLGVGLGLKGLLVGLVGLVGC